MLSSAGGKFLIDRYARVLYVSLMLFVASVSEANASWHSIAFHYGANAPLDELAQLIGLPGKLGMDGSKVWEAYCKGELPAIRNYCETDVANTYLVYLRFQLMRGHLAPDGYEREVELVKNTLGASSEPHWKEFIAKWG